MQKVIDSFSGRYKFLCNFYPSRIYYNLQYYATVEHAFQATKCFFASDARKIRLVETPRQAKALGQKVVRQVYWEEQKTCIMYEIIKLKFMKHDSLKKKLLDTDDAELIEGNTWGDKFWGVCQGRGKNELGIILMRVRAELKVKRFEKG